ncbi:hypothetical protein ASPFODRAFT_76836 [Aspergillus luchuensis CBS 106.47]|uniref:Uncharacterized protein n=1 Tax=Aspergillus luchuensis (strain CBS 106.47) TaxID=1137211 RepID=A0A1M3TZQ1_ASPLC|nr:hypothetical protein ASPFODRAFT_76836 [Aspergillus luchuensis CBS 106.47]
MSDLQTPILSKVPKNRQENVSVLWKPLDDAQQSLLESVGNKRLARRLYKRTFKIYSREDRLHAINFCQSRKHINPITGQERPISLSTASEILHISIGTLQRWIMEKQKITDMKQGSSRADKHRVPPSSLSNQFGTDDYAFLRLLPQQLFQHHFIQRREFYKLHPYEHPVPFIGIEGGRLGRLKSFADAYSFLGQAEERSHPGHPSVPATDDSMKRPSQPSGAADCNSHCNTSQAHHPTVKKSRVQYVNSMLYEIAPSYDSRRLGSRSHDPCYDEVGSCVALICQQIIDNDDRIESAIPVRVGFDYNEPFRGAPQHWAICFVFRDSIRILLPLSLSLKGAVVNEMAPDTLYLQGWAIDHELLKCRGRKRKRIDGREQVVEYMQRYYKDSQPIHSKFRLSPVLYITDVEMLFLQTSSWRPRRFAPTWTLYSTILHSSYRFGQPLSPMYGKYTDIKSMMNTIIEKAPRVSFFKAPVQPSQLVELGHFTLINRVTDEQILTRSSHHLDASGIGNPPKLGLEDIEKSFEHEDVTATSIQNIRSKITHALKLSLVESMEFVDEKRRCMFYTCPESQASVASYYCLYHSRALINHASNLSGSTLGGILLADGAFKREVSIRDDTREALLQLKSLYSRPTRTWIIDFEFISMPAKYSPIPLQFAIRQLDGKLLYAENVDYSMSMGELIEAVSPYVSNKHKMMGTLFLRCYGGLRTNGDTPFKIREFVRTVCGYDHSDVQLLSWFSAQDMQCFLRLLTGKDVLIHDKISHLTSTNFQPVNIGDLCRKLLPNLPSKRLESVREYLVRGKENMSCRNYHNASYDTRAMADIVEALVHLV